LEHLGDRIAGLLVGADDREPALGQHPDAGAVVLGDAGVQRTLVDLGHELRERARGQAAAPVLAADPVADLPCAVADPAAHMPDDLAAIDDRPHHQRVVGEELAPMRLVRRPVTRGERRHRIGDRIGLLAVEDL
jgi:hypothetical protein